MDKYTLFRAELVLLVNKYIGKPKSGYDIANAISDHAHDSRFSEFSGRFDEAKQDYVDQDMVEEAQRILNEAQQSNS